MAGYPYYSPMPYQQANYYPNMNPYYQQAQMQAQAQAPQQQQTQQAIQQSGFVLVQSEQEARSYPVAPGNSITFKDESQPYCYVKTMGFNQLDRPVFEKYRLVKEDDPIQIQPQQTKEESQYAVKSDLSAIWDEINALKERMKAQMQKKKVVKEVEVDDEDE